MLNSGISNLAFDRKYNLSTCAMSALVVLAFSSDSVAKSIGCPIVDALLSIMLSLDCYLRYSPNVSRGILRIIDILSTLTNCMVVLVDVLASPADKLWIQPMWFVGYGIRGIVALAAINSGKAPVSQLRRLTVETKGTSRASTVSVQLDIAYITPRLIFIGKSTPTSPEMDYLTTKYSDFLKVLPIQPTPYILPISLLATLADDAARHLFQNPVHVVAIQSSGFNSVLLACAIMLRTRVVHPPSAPNAISLFVSKCYASKPKRDTVLPRSLISQLEIFSTITKRSNSDFLASIHPLDPSSTPLSLRRVVLSQFDADAFSTLHMSVVDISSRRVLVSDITPSVSSSSLTFLASCELGSEILIVFTAHGHADTPPLFNVYVNPLFHLEKVIASSSSYHYISSTDECDQDTSQCRVSAKIEIFASANTDDGDGGPTGDSVADGGYLTGEELLLLPTYSATDNNSCCIV